MAAPAGIQHYVSRMSYPGSVWVFLRYYNSCCITTQHNLKLISYLAAPPGQSKRVEFSS